MVAESAYMEKHNQVAGIVNRNSFPGFLQFGSTGSEPVNLIQSHKVQFKIESNYAIKMCKKTKTFKTYKLQLSDSKHSLGSSQIEQDIPAVFHVAHTSVILQKNEALISAAIIVHLWL